MVLLVINLYHLEKNAYKLRSFNVKICDEGTNLPSPTNMQIILLLHSITDRHQSVQTDVNLSTNKTGKLQ